MENENLPTAEVTGADNTPAFRVRYASFGVVRDSEGNPRIDDPEKLHPLHIAKLTPEERRKFNLWEGAFGRDADGWKRFQEQEPDKFMAKEPIRALSEMVIGDKVYRVQPRPDLKTGQCITVRRI